MEKQSFEEVAQIVKDLLHIDDDNLDGESLKNNKIFVEMNKLHVLHSRILRDDMKKLKKLELRQHKHYTGKMPATHYREFPLPETVLKTDLDKYLAADDLLLEMREIVAEQDEIVSFLEESIKTAKFRGNDISRAIEWRKFITNGS